MKKLTIITTIALMLAFVLPMAQAQDKPATENSSAETVTAVEQSSQSTETKQAMPDKDEPQTQEQLLQAKQALNTQLQQLDIQKQKLLQQFQALILAQYSKDQAAQATIMAKEAAIKAQAEKDKAEKASKEAEKFKDKAEKAKTEAAAQKREQWANNWVNSKEFKQWQKDMEQWAKEYAKAQEQVKSSDNAALAAESKPMPVMPPMPPMPIFAEVAVPAVVVPAQPAPTVVIPKAEPRSTGTAVVAPPAEIAAPAPVPKNIS
jgi:hypothetical protein